MVGRGCRCVDRLPRPSRPDETRYFCPDSCAEMEPQPARDTGLRAFSAAASSTDSVQPPGELDDDQPDECPSVKYFCTPSADNVAVEVSIIIF